tara:strand:+ start:966 stop:1613 length:648 start_codon:yes stop_codon:yes gene_type:complete
MPEFVKMVNKSDREFKYEQRNVRKTIAPGGDSIVPWHLAATLFGSPGVQNVGNNKYRDVALKKKRAFNGFQEGFQTIEQWDAERPEIAVIDIETNERIYMLIDDPEGVHMGTGPVPTDKTDAEALQRQISTLQNEMQRLMLRIQAPQNAAVGDTSSVTPTTDGPSFEDIPDDSANDVSTLIPQAETAPTEDTPQAVATGDHVAPKPRRSRANKDA